MYELAAIAAHIVYGCYVVRDISIFNRLFPLDSRVQNTGRIGVGVTSVWQCGFDTCDETAENPGIYATNSGSTAFFNTGFNLTRVRGAMLTVMSCRALGTGT